MINQNPARPGYSTISPYFIVQNSDEQVQFIKSVFSSEISEQVKENTDGRKELKIGNTTLFIQPSAENLQARQSTVYVYVKNINDTYTKALGSNAKSIFKPVENKNGDAECAFEDVQGNIWFCAKFGKI